MDIYQTHQSQHIYICVIYITLTYIKRINNLVIYISFMQTYLVEPIDAVSPKINSKNVSKHAFIRIIIYHAIHFL